MLKILGITGTFALTVALSACATSSAEPTPEQRAACEKMLAEMGEGATHSHSTDKSGTVNTMGMTHARCRTMLGK